MVKRTTFARLSGCDVSSDAVDGVAIDETARLTDSAKSTFQSKAKSITDQVPPRDPWVVGGERVAQVIFAGWIIFTLWFSAGAFKLMLVGY